MSPVPGAPTDAEGPTRGFFDAWSRVYDFPIVQLVTYRPVQNAVVRALAREPARRVLDVGCGTGVLATRLAAAGSHPRVVGCDFSPGMLAHAVARARVCRADALFVRGDALRLPFADGVFDAVVSTEAFHWFPDQDAALRDFFRVLVPGGRLLLVLVSPHVALIGDVFHALTRLAGQPLRWPTLARLRLQIEEAGFRVERQRRILRLAGFLLPPALTEARRPGPRAG